MKMEHSICAHKILNYSSAQNSIILREESNRLPLNFQILSLEHLTPILPKET